MGIKPSFNHPEVTSLDGFNRLAEQRGWSVRCDGLEKYYTADTADLNALWRANAAGGIPRRSAMTARLLRAYLKIVTVHERIWDADGSRRYRVRLMGGQVAGEIGDGTGKFYDEFLPRPVVPIWNAMSDAVLAHGGPVRLLMSGCDLDNTLVGELFGAPMLTDDGRADLILSGSCFNSVWTWDAILAHWQEDMAVVIPSCNEENSLQLGRSIATQAFAP